MFFLLSAAEIWLCGPVSTADDGLTFRFQNGDNIKNWVMKIRNGKVNLLERAAPKAGTKKEL
jgi:hypothetical protein